MDPSEEHTHPSLCPPSHGYSPNEAPAASWVLVDLRAYIADRENTTSACCKMRNGKEIRVTFCTAPPPLVSYICVWCPDADLYLEPTVEAAESDLVLLYVSLRVRETSKDADYFVYKASGSKGPSLRLLQDSKPCLYSRYNITLLSHRDAGEPGNFRPHTEADDHYYVVALNRDRGSKIGDFRLWIFNSKDEKWDSRPFSLEGIDIHITSKVIALGDDGLLGFVDPWRGIVVCDVLGRRPARYLRLPPSLVRLDKFRDQPLLSRDITFVGGRLSVVQLSNFVEQGISSDYRGWKVSSFSRVVTDLWEEDWKMDYVTKCCDISFDSNTNNFSLLPNLQGDGQPSLQKLYIAHPTLSLSDNHVVYIMGKVALRDGKALVLSVNMTTQRLLGVAVFDAERMLGYTYVQSRISKYFNMAPGKRNAGYEIEKDAGSKKQKSVPKRVDPVKEGTNNLEKLLPPNKTVSSSLAADYTDSKYEEPDAWLKAPSTASVQVMNRESDSKSDEDVPSKATIPAMIKENFGESFNSARYCDSKDEPAVPIIPAKRPLTTDKRNGQDDSDESVSESYDGNDKKPAQKKLKDSAPSGAAKPVTKVEKDESSSGEEDGNYDNSEKPKAKEGVSSDDYSEEDSGDRSEKLKAPEKKPKTPSINQNQVDFLK